MRHFRKHKLFSRQLLSGIALLVATTIGFAQTPQGTTIRNEAFSSFLFKTGQLVLSHSNTTETIVQSSSVASVLTLTVSTDALIANGADSCFVESMVFDAAGNTVPDGQLVAFTTASGTFSNGGDTVSARTVSGRAGTWLRSMLARGQTNIALVTSQTPGLDGTTLTEHSSVIFFPAAISGAISSGGYDSPPKYQGITIKVTDHSGAEIGRDTTNADGSFLVPVERTGTYKIAFQYTNGFGDVVEWHASAVVDVPSVGGVPPINPLNSIGGMLIEAGTGQPVRKAGIGVILSRTDSDNPPAGRTTPIVGSTNNRGLFAFDSLAPGSYEIHVADSRFAGTLSLPSIKPGSFILDANLALVEGPTFEVVKTANKRIAEIGDAITYNLEIKNLSTNALLRHVRLIDELPVAFVYAKNSSRRDGSPLSEPLNSRKLEWDLGDSLKPGEIIKLSYSVYVGTAALEGDGINRAYAIAQNIVGQTIKTAVASAQVLVRPGVFTNRGIVIGKVFYDKNENGNQDVDENGIPGVELWMEDGTHIVTGDDGKYSLPEVLSGQHVIRINQRTLPVGSTSLAIKSASARDGLTRFVQLTEGGIARADFYIKPSNEASLKVFFSTARTDSGDLIHARYVIDLVNVGSPTSVCVTDSLPKGYRFDLQSITIHGKKVETDGRFSRSIRLRIPVHQSHSSDSIDVIIMPDSTERDNFTSRAVLRLTYSGGAYADFSGVVCSDAMNTNRVAIVAPNNQPKKSPSAEETIEQLFFSRHGDNEK